MKSELEDALVDALHARADAVPRTPMPRLEPAMRRGRLVPVAAAVLAVVAVVAVGVAALLLAPRDDTTATATATTATAPEGLAPGEVYYSLRLTDLGAGGVIRETQLWQPRDRAGEWRQEVVDGRSIEDGRVVPGGGRVEARPGGECFPAFEPTAESCTESPSWANPTLDFLASAPRDPATIADQLHAEAAAAAPSEDLAYVLELRMVGVLLAGNGVPADLASALRQVVAALPGVQVTEGMADLTGAKGTGYSLPYTKNKSVTVIFDEDDHYLGSPTEAVRHGVAPGLGEPPSRMLD